MPAKTPEAAGSLSQGFFICIQLYLLSQLEVLETRRALLSLRASLSRRASLVYVCIFSEATISSLCVNIGIGAQIYLDLQGGTFNQTVQLIGLWLVITDLVDYNVFLGLYHSGL